MKCFSILFLVFFTLSCASSPKDISSNQGQTLTLQSVEQFSFGKDTSTQLKEKLGSPTQILTNLSTIEDYWIYNVGDSQNMSTRATFTIRKTTGTLLGAVWIPLNNSEDFAHEESVLSHYQGLNFTSHPVIQNPHWRSDDLDFNNHEKSISFRVTKPSGVVQAITFGAPLATSSL